jgi:ubiquinone/menaquinone biosynthesis C-methylase UbiE
MAIKNHEGKKVVRRGGDSPSPYLRKKTPLLTTGIDWDSKKVLDLGCGAGRNSKFLKSMGFRDVTSLDYLDDYGQKWNASDDIPVADNSMDIIICNYIFMFLDDGELEKVFKEISRVAACGCVLIVEVMPIKTSLTPDDVKVAELKEKVLKSFESWRIGHITKYRFLVEKSS